MNHTPGSWKVTKTTIKGEFCWDYKIRAMDESVVCTVGPCEVEANAHLIAAAPEMLEALKNIIVWDDGNLPGDLIDIAKQAILKAEGRG